MGIYFLLQSLFSLDFSSLFECLCWSRDRSQQIPCPPQPSDSPGQTVGVHRFIFNGKQTSPVELFPAPAGPAKVCQSEELSSSSARCGMDKPPCSTLLGSAGALQPPWKSEIPSPRNVSVQSKDLFSVVVMEPEQPDPHNCSENCRS